MESKTGFRRWFSKVVYQRAKVSHEMGRIAVQHVDRNCLLALCRTHHARSEFRVLLSWATERGKMHAWCTCPDAWNHNPCEHIAAVMFELAQENVFPPGIPITPDSLVVRGQDEAVFRDGVPANLEALAEIGNDARADGDDEDLDPRTLPGGSGGPESVEAESPMRSGANLRQAGLGMLRPAHAWLSVLQNDEPLTVSGIAQRHHAPAAAPLATDGICYVLDLTQTLERGSPVVQLFVRQSRPNDPAGTPRRLRISPADIDQLPDPADQKILQLLLSVHVRDNIDDFSWYVEQDDYVAPTDNLVITPDAWDASLPALGNSGRFFWSISSQAVSDWHPVQWDEGQPWKFRLAVTEEPLTEHYSVRGMLSRPERSVPLSQATYFFGDRYVLIDNTLAAFECAASPRWLHPLIVAGYCEVPFRDRDELQKLLWSYGDVNSVDFPESLQLETELCVPVGRVRILRPVDFRARGEVPGRLEFLYGDRPISGDSQAQNVVDFRQRRVIPRDRQRESALTGEFMALARPARFYRATDGDEGVEQTVDTPMFELPMGDLEATIDRLIHRGWVVEAQGFRIRRASEFALSVTSGVDWFDVSAAADFGGLQISLPELLEAVRSNQRFIRLSDGTHGMLPQRWLDQYRALAELGERSGDAVRFQSSQVAILDALLAAQDNPIQLDAHYRQVRDRLYSFAGVHATHPDPTFHGELRDYQREGLGWLEFLREFGFGGCLADDMGLGKTVQVLAMLQRRKAEYSQQQATAGAPRPAAHSTLVVVPKSIVYNWIEEAQRFTPNLTVLNYTGMDRHQTLERLAHADIVVTTYGILRRDILKLREISFDYAILDEAQAIKNATSQASKACRLVKSRYRLAMTGTPVENHVGELWSLFDFLNPGMLGRSRAFQALISGLRRSGDESDPADLKMLAQAIKPFVLRRTKGDVIRELPEKTEHTLYCELSGAQKRLYAELRDYYRQLLTSKVKHDGIMRTKIHVLEALLRLRQAACHPGLLDDERRHQPSAKLEMLEDQVQEIIAEGHKVLIFSQFTRLLGIVKDRFDQLGIRYEYLDGRTRDRPERIANFQNNADIPVFLISLKAGGLGLNLTAADYVYILDPWWNPAVEAQAIDRAHRIGQTRPVIANRIICRDTVEEKILQLQQSKKKLADAIIAADSSLLQSLTVDDLQLLLS